MGAKWRRHVLRALWSPNNQKTTIHTKKTPFLEKLGSAEPSQSEIRNMYVKIPMAQDQWCHHVGNTMAPKGAKWGKHVAWAL